MVRQILDWRDKKFEELMVDDNAKHPYIKAFGLGAIEGAIDGAVIAYPMLIIACTIAAKELAKYKK